MPLVSGAKIDAHKSYKRRSINPMTEPEREKLVLYDGNKCPVCGGEIKTSGFTGNLFCWGKCYTYLNTEKYKRLLADSESKGGKE